MPDYTNTNRIDTIRWQRLLTRWTDRRHPFWRRNARLVTWRGMLLVCAIAFPIGSSTLHAKTLQWRLMPDQRVRLIVQRITRQKSPLIDWTETIQYHVLWVVTGRDDADRMQVLQKVTEVKHTLLVQGAQPVVYDSSLEGEPRGDVAELAKYWKPLLQVERPLTLSAQGIIIRSEPSAPNAASPSTAGAPSATSAPSTVGPPLTPSIVANAPASSAASPNLNPAASAASASATAAAPGSTPARTPAPRLWADVNWTLPLDDLAVGDSWAETQLAPWRDIADALKVTTSYTYQGEEDVEQQRLDKIVVQARWDMQPTAPRQLSIERQDSSGVIHFDEQAGHLARAEFSHDLGVRITPPQAEPVQAEISVVLTVRCQPVIPEPESETESPAPSPATPSSASPAPAETAASE